jgi:hypothetical protein
VATVEVVGATVVLAALAGDGGADGGADLPPPLEHAANTRATPAAATAALPRRERCLPMMNAVWVVVALAVVVGMFWLAAAMEPHWCSRDGSRFTCRVQEIDAAGRAVSRWYDARAEVQGDSVAITKKVLMRSGDSLDPRHVAARSDRAPGRRAIYLLDGRPMLAVRVPSTSRAVSRLDAMLRS